MSMPHWKIRVILCAAVLGIGWLTFSGCTTTKVSIRVKVPSEIDVDKYNRLAVIPFIEIRSKDKRADDGVEWGQDLATVFRRSLNRPHKFEILSAKDTDALLKDDLLDPSQLEDATLLATLGAEMEVDALIIGTYRFSSVSEPRRAYYDRYSSTLQRYVTDSVIYYQKSYRLAVELLVVDAGTGEIVWRHPYESKAWERHNVASFLISEAVQSDSIFRNLATQVAASFTRNIAPHYEKSERLLVRG